MSVVELAAPLRLLRAGYAPGDWVAVFLESYTTNETYHGYGAYDFFDQCPHRMACAKRAFYRPKGSAKPLFIEGRTGLLHLKQEIPLSEAEVAAVDDGVVAFDTLLTQLIDVPTASGPTPRQLESMRPLTRHG